MNRRVKEVLFVIIIPGLIWTLIILALQVGLSTIVGAWLILLTHYCKRQEVTMSSWEIVGWLVALVVGVLFIPFGLGSLVVDQWDGWASVAVSTLAGTGAGVMWLLFLIRRVNAIRRKSREERGGE